MATGIERLQFMVGEWDIQAYSMGDDGEWVDSPLPKQTKIESQFGGAFLQEQEVQMLIDGQVIRFFIMWSYDQYREVFRMIACDDTEGLMDVLEGNFKGDTVVVSNTNTGTPIFDVDGNKAFLRLSSTQTSKDSFTDEMHESFDNGESWLPIYRAVHSRKR